MSSVPLREDIGEQIPATCAVAVVSGGDGGERLASVLAERWQLLFFDSPEQLPVGDADFETIVLLMDDEAASIAAAVEPLAQRFPEVPVVVVRPRIQRWEIRSALTAGASGVVLQDEVERTLAACVQAVQAGQVCVPRMHRQQVEPPALSAREKQILGLVVMGYMNSEIAERLFLAESTVKSHLSSAFGKLGVRSRNEATSLILDPDRGLGMGILGLGGESIEVVSAPTR